MSSLSDRGDSEESIPLLDEINAVESCCSFKTSEDNLAADLGPDHSSGTSLNKSVLLNLAFGKSETSIKEDKNSIKQLFDTSTKADKDEHLDTNKDTGGTIPVESEQKKAGEEGTKMKKVSSSKLLDTAKTADTAGSGKSKLSISMKEQGQPNVIGSDPSPIHEQAIIGDTLPQGHVEGEKPVTASGESTVSPVLTILEPKTQSELDDDVVYRVQSEGSPTDKPSPSFFISNIVSGRLDLGDNAEMVDDLLYWRNPGRTAFVFFSVLSVLVSMRYYSVISVMAYVSLGCLSCGFVGKLYSTSNGAPNPILQIAPALSEENVRKITDITVASVGDMFGHVSSRARPDAVTKVLHLFAPTPRVLETLPLRISLNVLLHVYYLNDTILAIRRLYLADDLADSIKFGLVLWYLTYVGLWFNGMTIITICFVTCFTLPNIYEQNKVAIDNKMAVVWDKWLNLSNMARTASQEGIKRILSNDPNLKKVN